MTNSKVNVSRDIAWKVRISLHDSKSAWLQRRIKFIRSEEPKNHFASLLHYPALWIVKSNVSSFRSNEKFSPLDSAGIRIRIQKFWSNLRAVLNILCIDKGEEKEGTFHDNGGSLLVAFNKLSWAEGSREWPFHCRATRPD